MIELKVLLYNPSQQGLKQYMQRYTLIGALGLFFYIIHHNKDWNLVSYILACLCSSVLLYNPSQQGLKQVRFGVSASPVNVLLYNPSQQGLKPITEETEKAIQIVLLYNPSQQGLKLNYN